MLKGRHTALIVSVFAHIAVFLALIFLSSEQQIKTPKAIKQPSIKSYLYRPEKRKIIEIKPIIPAETIVKAKLAEVKKEPMKQPVELPKKLVKPKPIETKKIEELVVTDAPAIAIKPTEKKPVPQLPGSTSSVTKKKAHSLHNSLARLRNNINQQLADDAFKEHNQVRSASVMHADQIPVPHSEIKLTEEEKYKKNTKSTHAESITKNDDGTCTIVREQILGSPVEASVSGFSCGESKFDKSFREHMEKVNKKFVTYKK